MPDLESLPPDAPRPHWFVEALECDLTAVAEVEGLARDGLTDDVADEDAAVFSFGLESLGDDDAGPVQVAILFDGLSCVDTDAEADADVAVGDRAALVAGTRLGEPYMFYNGMQHG